ncbi:Protein GrpE [Buchnera aphidicola (Protaphis terricola)]|uniref:nucleotide exchange factor GrpE n=1 Tax=Buchnera aphidicola TaxID=9 RepID=UPI0034646DC6
MDTEKKQTKEKNTKTQHKKNKNDIIQEDTQPKKININQLKTDLSNNKKKINDIKLRHLANIENIKKNTEIEIKNIKNIKKEQFFREIIPVIDILEEILSYSKEKKMEHDTLIQGIQLTLKSLLKITNKFGLKIEDKKNEIFNPKIHHVILTENSNKTKPNHVVSVKQKGFIFKNIILRKASIILSKT